MDPVAVLSMITQIVGLVSGLLPSVEADVAAWKGVGSADQPAVDLQVLALNESILALSAKLDALK